MYPPEQARDCKELLERLLSSLQRAGLEIEDNVGLFEKAGTFSVKARLKTPIPEKGWDPLKNYMGWYSLVSGWRVQNIRKTEKYLTFNVQEA